MCIAKEMMVSFVGCGSQRFNLEIQDFMEEHHQIVDRVISTMNKLFYIIRRAKLR